MPAKTTKSVLALLWQRRNLITLFASLAIATPLVSTPQAALAAAQETGSISAGTSSSCAIESGRAYCWGDDEYGELGDGKTYLDSTAPVAVDASGVLAGKTLTKVTVGQAYACTLDTSGAAYCWGANNGGTLGDGNTTDSSVPVAVDTSGVLAGKTLTQITAGYDFACALDSSGAAYCWGVGNNGDLGDGSTASSSVPVAVDMSGVLAGQTLTQIAAGSGWACAVDSAGAAYCWGGNDGSLGDGSTAPSTVPVAVDTSGVLAGKTLTQISAGFLHTCAVDSDGAAYCWGFGYYGELGEGSTTDSTVPVAVDTSGVLAGKTLTQITAGEYHTCALDTSGAAYCWGDDGWGALGNGVLGGISSVPVAVDTSGALAGRTLTQIAAQESAHECALDSRNAVFCWGYNYNGELGDGNTSPSDVPVLTGPQAPGDVTATPGANVATVSWSPPTALDGGSVTGYTATAIPDGQTCSAPASATACTITGLTAGTTYSIAVVAHTTVGDSGESAPVNITPGSGIKFTSRPADRVTFDRYFVFIIRATGFPVPSITKIGKLPPGVHFRKGPKGVATISGTPKGKASGIYNLMLIAKNRSAQAMQSFTLTVDRAPEIMKIHARKVRIGSALIVPITTVGYPPPVLTESGRLPKGLSFTDFGNGTAALTGTPAPGTSGSYPITVTATNRSGMVCRSFTLKIPQSRSALVSSPRLPNVADSLDLPVPASAASGSH